MITFSILFAVAALAVSFGAGYALGYNIAKHPEKVQAQADKVVTDIKSKL